MTKEQMNKEIRAKAIKHAQKKFTYCDDSLLKEVVSFYKAGANTAYDLLHAENEALRAEIDKLKDDRNEWRSRYIDATNH